jgi:hypothetical protein
MYWVRPAGIWSASRPPAPVGPAAGGFWPLVAIICLVLSLIGLTNGFDTGWRRERDCNNVHPRTDQPPPEGIAAKLRELQRLKEGNLISEDEYQRKRQDIIEKW